MKLKDKDGNEVEIDDNEKIVTIAQQLEQLGYEDIASVEESYKEKLEKLEKQTKADNEFIQRMKNEIGELRKTTQQKVETPMNKQEDTPKIDSEEEFGKKLATIESTLTDEEREYAAKQFEENYKASTPEQRALLKTNEGRAAFIELVFSDKAEVISDSVSLFPKKQPDKKSISEMVKDAFSTEKKNGSKQPLARMKFGIPDARKQEADNKQTNATPSMASSRTGDIRAMLKSITQ